MSFTIAELAEALGVAPQGDATLRLERAAEPAEAGPDDLAIALSPRWAERLVSGRARAALLWPGADWRALKLVAAIEAPRGRLAMARMTQALDPGPAMSPGRHPTAVVEAGAEIGEGTWLGPLAVVGAGALIGAGSRIGAHVSIAAGAEIGAGAVLHPGVRIGRRVRIGARAILQPGAVIGGDGFSFVTATPSHQETARTDMGRGPVPVLEDPTWHRIHSLGGVDIGDDVEIGANCTIDAGTIRPTRIGDGTKIDNLVQVGHNSIIGRHCLLCGHVGLAGSCVIGDRAVLGGKVGVADNLSVGEDAVLAGASIVLSNVPAGRVMLGYPATRMDAQVESYKALRRLPRLIARLARSEKPVPKDGSSD